MKHKLLFNWCRILLCSALFLTFSVNAATVTSTQNGDWNTPTTWGGTAPVAGDDVVVANNVRVNAATITCASLTINSGATLTFDGNNAANTLVVNGNLTVNGTLNQNNNAGFPIEIHGNFTVNGTYQTTNQNNANVKITMKGNGGTTIGGTNFANNNNERRFLNLTIDLNSSTAVVTLLNDIYFSEGNDNNNSKRLTINQGILNATGRTINFYKTGKIITTANGHIAWKNDNCAYDAPNIHWISPESGSDLTVEGTAPLYINNFTYVAGKENFKFPNNSSATICILGNIKSDKSNIYYNTGTWYWGPDSNYDRGAVGGDPTPSYTGANGAANLNSTANAAYQAPAIIQNTLDFCDCEGLTKPNKPAPSLENICTGETLSALEPGTHSYTYRWQTAATGKLTTGNPTTAAATGTKYYLREQNGTCWSVASEPVTVIGSVPGNISPTSRQILPGTSTNITLTGYTGTIQWQSSPNGVDTWSNIDGETSATLSTGNLALGDYYYRAVVTNASCAPAYSAVATISASNCNAISVQDYDLSGFTFVGGPYYIKNNYAGFTNQYIKENENRYIEASRVFNPSESDLENTDYLWLVYSRVVGGTTYYFIRNYASGKFFNANFDAGYDHYYDCDNSNNALHLETWNSGGDAATAANADNDANKIMSTFCFELGTTPVNANFTTTIIEKFWHYPNRPLHGQYTDCHINEDAKTPYVFFTSNSHAWGTKSWDFIKYTEKIVSEDALPDGKYCEGAKITFIARGLGDNVQWYENAVFGTPLATGNTYMTSAPFGTDVSTIWYAYDPDCNITLNTTVTTKFCCSSVGTASTVFEEHFDITNVITDQSTDKRNGVIIHRNYQDCNGYCAPLPAGKGTIGTQYSYNNSGSADGCNMGDNEYAIVKSSGNFSWWSSRIPVNEHTANGATNSGALMVNASFTAGLFYTLTLSGVCPNTSYDFSAWYASVANPNQLPSAILFEVYQSLGGVETLVESKNTGDFGGTAGGSFLWHQMSLEFTTPAVIAEGVTYVLKLKNNYTGGEGNDLLIDDIVVTKCSPTAFAYEAGTANQEIDVCSTKAKSIELRAEVSQWGLISPGGEQTVYCRWMYNDVSKDLPDDQWIPVADKDASTSKVYTFNPQDGVGSTRYFRAKLSADSTRAANISSLSALGDCAVTDIYSGVFTVNQTGDLSLTPTQDTIVVCKGTAVNLKATVTTPSGDYSNVYWCWSAYADITTVIPSWTQGQIITQYSLGTPQKDTVYYIHAKKAVCLTDAKITVKVNESPTITLTSSNNTQSVCENAALTAITYTLGGGATGATVTGLPAGVTGSLSGTTYTISGTPTVTGTFNYTVMTTGQVAPCTAAQATGTITVNAKPNVSVNSPTICTGDNATLTASGTADTYSWTPGTNLSATIGASVTATAPTNGTQYTVEGTATATGCKNTATATITVNAKPNVAVNSPEICADANATLTASGADTYTWTPTSGLSATIGASVTATAPTNGKQYTVEGTVTATGCKNTAVATITVNPKPTANAVPTQILCAAGQGINTGSIDLTVTGGTPGYTYAWSNSATTKDLTGLSAGNYSVTVTDSKGCTATASATINAAPTAISAAYDQTPATCGANNGTVTVKNVTGGTGGYTYNIGGGGFVSEAKFTGLAGGEHTVTVKDANGCEFNLPATVAQSGTLSGSIAAQTNVSCNSGSNGSVTVEGSGGTPDYQYKLGSGVYQDSGTFNGLTAGNYTVTVKDDVDCTYDVAVTIT